MRKSLKKKGLAFLLSVMLTVSNFSGISAYAADVSGIAEGVADKTAPVITVKEAVQGHGHGDTYCEAPVVTVTDAESASLKIETDIGGTKTETEYQENTVTVPIEGQYVRVEITATNDAGLSAKVRFTISHTLAGRQGFTVPATCTEPEKYVGVIPCKYCDIAASQWETKKGSPLGHKLGEPQQGETSEGVAYTKKVCETCGFEEITFEDMSGHEHTFATVTNAPQCTKEGSVYEQCTDCGYIDQSTYQTIKVTGHRMSDYQIVKQPDCGTGENGRQESKCKNGCGYTYGLAILPRHTWTERKVRKEPTCTEAGESAVQCETCGTWDENSVVTIAMKDHQWVDHDHNCTTPMQCSECSAENGTAQKEHALSYHSDENGHWQECENEGCDYQTEPTGHEFPVQSQPDCTGSATCNICGYVKSGNETHNLEWIITPTEHYSYCKNEGCTYRSEPEAHAGTFDNDCETPTLCNKCGYAYVAAKSHTPFGPWYWNSEGHYKHCRYCAQIVLTPHTLGEDDGDCTTPVKCSHALCEYVMEPGQISHDFTGEWLSSEEGHFHECQNPNCTVRDTARKHSGGMASCISKALCDICGNYYGEVNPLNHMGEREVRNYKEPTELEMGYTGDTYCLDCDTVIEQGEDIPNKPHDHVYDNTWKNDGTHHWKECMTCSARSDDYAQHQFTEWESNEAEHFRTCQVCGYIETVVHIPEEDDHNCETPLRCSVCQKILVEAKTHHFDDAPYWAGENGHYQLCQNGNCTGKSEEQPHTGGIANCSNPASCELCHTEYGEKNPEHHVGGEEVLGYKAATLDTPGYTGDIYCLGCSQVKAYGQEIPAGEREHDFVQDYDEYYHWYSCRRCGERQENSYEEHQYDETGECTVCGYAVPVTEHTHHWDEGSITTEPTCESIGVKTYYCSECGEHRLEEILKKAEHTWDTGKVTKAPDCTLAGEKTYTCTVCKTTRTETIPATGHKWGEWYVVQDSLYSQYKYRTCSVCKAVEKQDFVIEFNPTMELSAKRLVLQKGQKTKVFRIVSMTKGDYVKSVKSKNKSVLKVQKFTKSGAVTLKAKKIGKTALVITLASGMTKTVKVRVQKKKVKTTKIAVEAKKVTLKKGKKLKLKPSLFPITSQQKITFKSANKKVAKVSAKGVVVAKKAGKTRITIRSGAKKIIVKIIVKR